MKFTKLFAAALTLWSLVYAHPTFAADPVVEPDASVGYCEGCASGTVELTLNGVSRARVTGLVQKDNGKWYGVGRVDYSGHGISITDLFANFEVELVPSETASVSGCSRVPLIASSVRILGSTGYLISTSDFEQDRTYVCAQGKMKATIDEHPKSLGRIKQQYRI